jgi:hypothetical protein
MAARPGKNNAKGRTRHVPAPAARPESPITAMPVGAPPIALLRTSKGPRPEFFADPAIDQLFAIVTALAAEASVAFDRIDTLERLLEQQGALSSSAVEAYQPGDAAVAVRSQRREELLQRVFGVLQHSTPRRAR